MRSTGYRFLKKAIKHKIHSGDLKNNDKLPSIRDMARSYEISVATVQRAVRELSREGYLHTRRGKGVFVSAQGKGTVGIIASKPEGTLRFDEMFGPLVMTVQEVLLDQGHNSLLMQGIRETKEGITITPPSEIEKLNPAALILVETYDFPYIYSLKELGIPIVATDVDCSELGVHSVFFDNIGSAFILTDTLIARGHTDIVFLGGLRKTTVPEERASYDMSVNQRVDGFRLAMEHAGLDAGNVVYVQGGRGGPEYREALNNLFSSGMKFTAMVTENPLLVVFTISS